MLPEPVGTDELDAHVEAELAAARATVTARAAAARRRVREQLGLAITAVLAAGVPLLAHHHLTGRVAGLETPLTELTGEPATIGAVEAGLTGDVRISDIAIGDLLRVDAVEASVALDRLLAGELGADELRVERPRIRIRVDRRGDSDLARLIRRVARRPRPASIGDDAAPPLRRIVVTGGDLIVDLGDGRIEARGVELHPQPGGVRLVTGPLRAATTLGPAAITVELDRSAADVALPAATVGRFVAVGGAITVDAGAGPVRATGVVLGRGVRGGGPDVFTLAATVDDGGVARPLAGALALGATPVIHVRGRELPLAGLASLAPAAIDVGAAHATGEVTITLTAAGPHIVAAGAVPGLRVDDRAIADAPFALDLRGAVDATVAGSVIDVASARLGVGALEVVGHGRLRRGGPAGLASAELELAVAPTPCLAALEALPGALIGPVAGLTTSGSASARAHLRFDAAAPLGEGVELTAAVDVAGCEVTAEPVGADVRTLAGAAEHPFPGGRRVVGPGVGDWIALDTLPGFVSGAFVAAEDARFATHPGFDLVQIARSLEVDLREGRFARGGSTISQQLVKNALLTRRRSLARKLQEAVLTWRLEARLDKRTILARYLNVIELGPDVYGIAAAARHWFGKPPSALTVREAAFLAALTPEPVRMARRIATTGELDPQSSERVDVVMRAMRRAGVIAPATHDAFKNAPLAFRADVLRNDAVPPAATAAGD